MWVNAVWVLLGPNSRTGCINHLLSCCFPAVAHSQGILHKWIIHPLDLIRKASVTRHFCTVFPHSGLLTCAVECEAVNGLWRGRRDSKKLQNIHILSGCKLTDLLAQMNSEWLQPEDQRSDLVTWRLRARLQERAGKCSGIWLNNNLRHINILTWSQNSRSRFSDLNTDSIKYGQSF